MEKIISTYKHKIKKIIKNFTNEYNEDLEQEIYIKTYQNLDKYKEQNKFSQWISTIAANVCRDYLRSAHFKKQSITDCDDEKTQRIQDASTPEKVLTSKERQKIILREINRLPKKMKEVIILYEFEDYSYEKLSNKLNVPQGTIKSRLNSARKILQENLSFLIKEEN